jgi:serine/threonine-protein kinase HipA
MASRTVRTVSIRLGEVLVGHLSRYSDGRSFFVFDETYLLLGAERPVLGLSFTDPGDEEHTFEKLQETYTRNIRLPPYFRNLLPEGTLREWMARKLGTTPDDEMALLEGLGGNLPGAVIAEREETPTRLHGRKASQAQLAAEGKRQMLFSLGGAQLKLAMVKQGSRFSTTPQARKSATEWIIKPPHPTFPRVPENEFAMLSFARTIGIDTPDAELVDLKELDLGEEADILVARGERLAYAIQRFDRDANGTRIHTEDFAQVFGVDPEDEYTATNYDTVGNLIFGVFPDPYGQLTEYVRRLVFMILIGNSDAHLKNWSVIYRDGRTPQLSPAYDLVSTIQYVPDNRTLALNVRREREFAKLSADHFARMAKRIQVAPAFVLKVLDETVDRARESWPQLARQLPRDLKATLQAHHRTLAKEFRIV